MFQTQTCQDLIITKEASDGFIAKSSQIGSNTTSWNPTQVEARGVNHMEMGTHALTEEILRDAWNGQIGVPTNNPFFIAIR